ncbi:phage tail tube protein [Streptomyces sp. NPDC018019]|uniref:phage tail tube protein n=1 Tax=Streptomyces sp. NPDC018019 TaxID=3365030 RepID=UPI00378FE23B
MSTPTPPAETITALARRYRCEIDMSTDGTTPAWTLLPGISEFAPKIEPTQQESTTYDAEGWVEQTVTMLAWSIETTIAHRAHPTTGAFNAVQEKLRKASMAFGADSYVRVRYYDRNGAADAYAGQALVTWEPDGGGADELDTVKVTLTGSGPLVEITNPAAGTGKTLTPEKGAA